MRINKVHCGDCIEIMDKMPPESIGTVITSPPYNIRNSSGGGLKNGSGGKWGALLPSIPEGQNYLWHTNRGGGLRLFGWRTRYWSFLLKLAKNQPSWTIQAQPGSAIGPFHWHSRKLTSLEMYRLQTFPDGLTFACGRTDVQKMLGNAVPSLIAEVLAREIRCQLLGDESAHGPLKLIPPVRYPVPDPEAVVSAPTHYRNLIGNHPDHPGEGRLSGRREKKRPARDNQPLIPTVAD